ncbi:cordon-bleu protein-like 1b isoform X2 [Archocentrus centrarchus]|uniref:cordon-bleu protein-like 1b isoform X2 n=1 Tax=Archocentrus centrarchus TaxID=63155 RepID=UPI0011E9B858|nr:cordon-bleu protein-like 1 isoform X2 [Archocentrus centrarchus]
MEVGSCLENQLHSCPTEFVKPMSLVMDDHGSQSHPRSSGLRVSTKSKAPSPPGLKELESPGFSQRYPRNPYLKMDQKENLIDKELSLTVVLPGGVEKTTIVHGSKPLMDLLVTLCAKYHLNPSSHTLELVTSNRNNIKLKPSALIGTLDAEKIILKPKGEDKNKKTGPQMPEATVRMVINYKKTQKTILRVNPRVPLAELLPAICEKCEFDVETTVLLKDVQSLTPLDLSSSLSDYAIREVYARDTKAQPATPVSPSSLTYSGTVTPGKEKYQKERENKGLFGTFRKSKKKSDQPTTASAPASPVLVSKPRPLSMALPSTNSSPLDSPTISTDAPKKRRAPQPPVLVSQSCTSDPSTRRRLHSEPNARLDSDQVCGLSRGSSAESSLRRTKRKAPPPPTSPSLEPVFPDENLQGDAAQRLEEIREQEEMTASVTSAAANNTQREDGSLNVSSDVSLHSPSPDVEMQMSVEGSGEDQSHDLSSEGNQQQSTLNDSITSSVRKTDGTESSELADTNCVPLRVENVSPHPICHESTTQSAEAECSTATSSLPPPIMQDAEAQASVQATAESLRELTNQLENPVATGTSCSTGEDAQVQTEFTQLPVPPPQHVDNDSSPAIVPACESPGKKDMATLTEDLGPPHLEQALPSTLETSSRQDSIPSALATPKVPPMYATDSEPKPKPSNELTRDYIPKVGMTTYTIVPQKSLEKLRYFEVALTLETPTEASGQVLNTGSPHSDESTRQTAQMEISKEKSELPSTLRREDGLTSTTTNQHTVNGSIPESAHLASPTSLCNADKVSSSANGASPAGSPAEAKEMKIPPATKPKPASFRLSQHKKTPGYYVTSAAEKGLSANSSFGLLKEAQGSAERADLPPPPPPPPVECEEVTTGATNTQLSPKQVDKNVPFMRMTRQSSLPARDPGVGLSLEKLRSFAAPRPYSPVTPSRFAQAVSSAVKRSHSVSYRPKSPLSTVSPPVSPITSHPPVIESKRLSKLEDSERSEADLDGSALQRAEVEPPSFSETVQTEEASP